MEFNYIINPETGKKVNINGKTGRKVLNNYVQAGSGIRSGSRIPSEQYYHTGGAIRGSSRFSSEQYCQNGGNKCKKYKKTKDPKCHIQEGCKWVVKKGCLEDSSNYRLETPDLVSSKAKSKASPKKAKSKAKASPTYYMMYRYII